MPQTVASSEETCWWNWLKEDARYVNRR